MRRWTSRKLLIAALIAISALVGCVLGGPGEPGCDEDAECGEGFSCRAGACFREENRGGAITPDAGGSTSDASAMDGGGDADPDASEPGDAATD